MLRRPPERLLRLQRRLRATEPTPRARRAVPLQNTAIERAVAALLDRLHVAYVAQWRGLGNLAVDFFVPAAGLIIECQGTWYHGDPGRYAPRELNSAQRRKRAQDAALQRLAQRAGLRWLELWEEDIRRRPEWCEQQLRRQLAPAAGEPAMSERVCAVTLSARFVLALHHGDLTAEPVDAIVNAANGHLAHGGGVAGAIVRRGGAVIQQESDQWVRRHGPVPTGQVAVTSAGSLPCRIVIHAVGPVWRNGDVEPEQLRSAVAQALLAAHERGLTSLAMPAISSGIFGFPKPLCADILIDTAVQFCEANPTSTVREIRFTNFDEPTVDVFRSAFAQRFGPAVAG